MIPALPLFHRIADTDVVVVGDDEAAAAKRRLVERAGGRIAGPAALSARLAFVSGDDAEKIAAGLRARGLLVNVVDRPELCDFTVPSILDRAPVLIAIGTAGASAGLAKALRLRLETLLPARLGALAEALAGARGKMRARFPDAGQRRRALDAALGAGGVLDPLVEGSDAQVAEWLAGSGEAGVQTAEFHLNSPDPEELTLRCARLLGSADVVAHEPGIAGAILDRARADAVRIALAAGAPAPPARGLTVVLRG